MLIYESIKLKEREGWEMVVATDLTQIQDPVFQGFTGLHEGRYANCVCVLAACKAANKGGECVFHISHSCFLFESFICIMSIPFCLSSYPALFILLTLFENTSVNDCPFFPLYVFLNFIFAFLFIFLHSY